MIRMSDVQHIEQAPAPGPSPLDVARLILAAVSYTHLRAHET